MSERQYADKREKELDPRRGDISLPVDLIRTVAIALAILLHASTEPHVIVDIMSRDEIVRWWASNFYNSLARPAIPLFIMLTGALLLQSSKTDEPLKAFFRKRWRRIGLPFIFWGVAYFAWRFFVNGEALDGTSMVQGILTGPYTHFWYLYLLIGLYILTPVFRIVVAYSGRKLLRYFLVIWFVGTAIVPLVNLSEKYVLNANVFLLTGWIGYFVLGAYLSQVRWRTPILRLLLVLGYLWTIFGTYLLVATIGEQQSQFFYNSFSFNVIMGSVALFQLLSAVPMHAIVGRLSLVNRLVREISQNTLPIYLFHVMVMETLQKGYLGFKISLTTMNPFLEIPLITISTLFISLGIIMPLKKIPHFNRLIG